MILFGEPWDQGIWAKSDTSEDAGGDDFFVGGVSTDAGGEIWISGRGRGEAFMTRLAGTIFVSAMPDAGLHETVRTLTDLYDFYAREPRKTLPPSSVERVTGRVTSRTVTGSDS